MEGLFLLAALHGLLNLYGSSEILRKRFLNSSSHVSQWGGEEGMHGFSYKEIPIYTHLTPLCETKGGIDSDLNRMLYAILSPADYADWVMKPGQPDS